MFSSPHPGGDRAPSLVRPRSGRIKDAVLYSGFARSKLYELAADYPDLFRKAGARVIVDYDVLDAIIAALPRAVIKPPKKQPPRDFSEIGKARASP
jgi:hypothetical protein